MMWQAVVYDPRDYIIEHKNFNMKDKELAAMLEYIKKHATSTKSFKVEITKWIEPGIKIGEPL